VVVVVLAAEDAADLPADAMAQASVALRRMRGAALAAGVPESGLASRELMLRQGYDEQGRPHGFVAELVLAVRSPDVAAAGTLISACISAGGRAARLQSVGFEHSDPSRLQALARDAAFADARARAEQLAGLAGRALGQVREVVEGGSGGPVPIAGRAKLMAAEIAPPVDAGSLEVGVGLAVTWSWA
jgi:uncharacterized protein YggE